MGEVLVSVYVSVQTTGGGRVPPFADRGVPPSGPNKGYPILPDRGVPPSQVRTVEYPHPRSGQGGTTSQVRVGVPYPDLT